MQILRDPKEVQAQALRWKQQGTVALVPTMGALHAGHLSLVASAREAAKHTIVSIFVNPLQFGVGEDFDKYPRTFENDRQLLEQAGVSLLFAPTPVEMYPKGFDTKVRVDAMASHLCGISRPGHFEGVATICLKLFQITQADIAVFGEKDFQQLRILQRMATDLNLPLRIQPHPTVREKDGLALSSRNRYLSTDERRWAAHIPQALDLVAEKAKSQPETRVGELIDLASAELSRVPLQVEYLSLASEWDLVPVSRDTRVSAIESPHFFLAVRAGQTRLIDNRALAPGRDRK